MEPQLVLISKSHEQTLYWGRLLGMLLSEGDVVALTGELGAGKTTLTQGIADGLGVGTECYVTSPTFTIINEYRGRVPVYHLDFYRIDSPLEVKELEGDAKISIDSPEKMQAFLEEEDKMLRSMSETIAKIGANVVFCQKGVDDSVQHHLAKAGVLTARRVKKIEYSTKAPVFMNPLSRILNRG